MTEQSPGPDEPPRRRRLSVYNLAMLALTLIAIVCGAGLLLVETRARGDAQKFYDAVQTKIGESDFLQEATVERMAQDQFQADDPVSTSAGGQIVVVYSWRGYLQTYQVTVTYNRSSAVALRVGIESVSRFGKRKE